MMEGLLNVDNFDKSLIFSFRFTMEGSLGYLALKRSLVNLSLQIFTLKFLLIKAGKRVVQKAIIFLLTPPLVLFKMADKISMKVTSQRYISVSDISLTM